MVVATGSVVTPIIIIIHVIYKQTLSNNNYSVSIPSVVLRIAPLLQEILLQLLVHRALACTIDIRFSTSGVACKFNLHVLFPFSQSPGIISYAAWRLKLFRIRSKRTTSTSPHVVTTSHLTCATLHGVTVTKGAVLLMSTVKLSGCRIKHPAQQ